MANAKTDMLELAVDLSKGIRELVLPQIGSAAARTHAGTAVGGDVTFGIDEVAEDFLVGYLKESGANVAMYSEDRGLLNFGEPEYVLIVDPVDGTRPAAAGLEGAMVSVAVAEYSDKPAMGDVIFGCLMEIKSGTLFTARRGGGVVITTADGEPVPVILSENEDLSKLFWTIGFRGRPARVLIEAMGDLVDISSVDGAVFDLGSATYSITRILTGQLDAYIDIGPRMIDEVPEVKSLFEDVGKGAVLNNSPHDLAAAGLICSEAGAIFGDGWGKSLGNRLLLGSDHSFQMSCVAAANPGMHARIIEAMDAGIEQLRSKFGKGS
ncbi:MAG: inositol monophosphatase family protein [Thermoleophilia bacterium]|jgi:myo-inositol-1(or 4)-monophosphatase